MYYISCKLLNVNDASLMCLFQKVPQVDEEGYSIRPDNPTQSILSQDCWWSNQWFILLRTVLGSNLFIYVFH